MRIWLPILLLAWSVWAKNDTTNNFTQTATASTNGLPKLNHYIDSVQCDVVIRLEPPSFGSKIFIFARYWVAKDYYYVSVIWAEPHGPGLWFPIYPPSLSLGSDTNMFSVNHGIYPNNSASFRKPIGERGVFRHLLGAYPIQETRFADYGATRLSVRQNDIGHGTNYFGSNVLEVINPRGSLDAIKFLDMGGQPWKSISYEYNYLDSARPLNRQVVTFNARPIRVGFAEGGVQVKVQDQTFQFSDLDLTQHAGGRVGSVNYKPVTFGGHVVQMPFYTEIRQIPDGPILRSASFTKYLSTSLDSNQANQAAREYSAFTSNFASYRKIITKYWHNQPQDVSQSDRIAIQNLRDRIQVDRNIGTSSIGESLRRANALIELNRVLGDNLLILESFNQYIDIIQQHNMLDLLLIGGAGVVENSMLWNRPEEADLLVEAWSKSVSKLTNILEIKHFVGGEVKSGRVYAALRLLQRIEANSSVSSNDLFEFAAMQYFAWSKLHVLLNSQDSNLDLLSRAQLKWVSRSVSINKVEKERRDWGENAKRRFDKLTKPSQEQLVWKGILETVDANPKSEANRQILPSIKESPNTKSP
jgi:hypothetical protein